jgi:hypothetical protein
VRYIGIQGNGVYVVRESGLVEAADLRTTQCCSSIVRTRQNSYMLVDSCLSTPSGLFIGSQSGQLCAASIAGGSLHLNLMLQAHKDSLRGLALVDESHLLSGGLDGELLLHDLV